MALDIQVRLEDRDLRAFLDRLGPKRFGRALSVGLNTTARQVRTRAARIVAREMGARRKDIDASIRVTDFSRPETLRARVTGSGSRLPLRYFGARQTARGVTAKAWNVRRLYRGSFVLSTIGGHVFRRAGRSRLPIRKMWGPGVPDTMLQDAHATALRSIGMERLRANLDRQVRRYLFSASNG